MNKPRNRNVKNRGNARSPGKSPRLPNNGAPQQITNPKWLNSLQKRAFYEGVEIWV
jgi:hypothetical protein